MFTMRYDNRINAVKEYIQRGLIGEIHNIYFGGQHPLKYGIRPHWYYEEGKHGGVINDIAIHGIDIVRYACGLKIDKILSARCWNAYAKDEKNFSDSGQFIIVLDNGAGLIADVSYAVPNSIGFSLPHYWEFNIWGSKGMIKFSMNSEHACAYLDGKCDVIHIKELPIKHNLLDDYLHEINGEMDILLNTDEVIKSSEDTLLIQNEANYASLY